MRVGLHLGSVTRVSLGVVAGLAIFVTWNLTQLGGDAPPPLPSAREQHVRVLCHARLGFKAYVFADPAFPRCDYSYPSQLTRSVGPYSVRTIMYDLRGRATAVARQPGAYHAVAVVTPASGRMLRRFFTLYRLAETPPSDWRYSGEPTELARIAGVPAPVVAAQRQLVLDTLRERTYSELSRSPDFARLLSGLAITACASGPPAPVGDALAADRRWWVWWKQQFYGLNHPGVVPLDSPRLIDGTPAPVVHEGSLTEAGMLPAGVATIDAFCRDWASHGEPGFNVCIVRKGVIVLHAAYGTSDGRPVTVTTRGKIASITKPMAASLLMMLVDQGRLKLDDPVESVLPPLCGRRGSTALTFRHLYTHTHGLERWLQAQDDLPDYEERVADCYPFLKIGKGWFYHGTGNVLGGKAIEALSGKSLPDAYRDHLLKPLGCNDTIIRGTHADGWSIPLDLARFGQMLLNRGSYGSWRFFRPETFEQMLPRPISDLAPSETKRLAGIGLLGTPEQFGHPALSGSILQVRPKDELVVAATKNTRGKDYDRQVERFMKLITSALTSDRGSLATAGH